MGASPKNSTWVNKLNEIYLIGLDRKDERCPQSTKGTNGFWETSEERHGIERIARIMRKITISNTGF